MIVESDKTEITFSENESTIIPGTSDNDSDRNSDINSFILCWNENFEEVALQPSNTVRVSYFSIFFIFVKI